MADVDVDDFLGARMLVIEQFWACVRKWDFGRSICCWVRHSPGLRVPKCCQCGLPAPGGSPGSRKRRRELARGGNLDHGEHVPGVHGHVFDSEFRRSEFLSILIKWRTWCWCFSWGENWRLICGLESSIAVWPRRPCGRGGHPAAGGGHPAAGGGHRPRASSWWRSHKFISSFSSFFFIPIY